MKRIFTMVALAATSLIFAQENTSTEKTKTFKYNSVALHAMVSDPGQFGLSWETSGAIKETNKLHILNISYGMMNYDLDFIDIDGSGFVIELGRKHFIGEKEYIGLYAANYLSYGNIKFDKETLLGKFDGTYSYFSFFAPELGYKFQIGKITIDPFVGANWKIEVKGKGDIDNKNTDEWAFRGGLKVGYIF